MKNKYKYRLFKVVYCICVTPILLLDVITYLLHSFSEYVISWCEVIKKKIIELKEEEL